jgi:hypothetical protein
MSPEQQQKVARVLAAVERELRREQPLIVGPWIGEVGHEILYWIPFVRWALTTFKVPEERVVIVSRGGTAAWYSGIGRSRYVDAFDLMSPSELTVLGNGAKPKQDAFSDAAGDELLRRAQSSCRLGDVARLLPHWMYRLNRYYWGGHAAIDFVEQHSVWARFEPPWMERLTAALPSRYVAVRFYFSRSLPDSDANRRFAQTMIDRLAAVLPVVTLNHSFPVDDHHDYQPTGGTVTSVAGTMSLADNLAVQTAVFGRAAAFVGTYGGLSMVPPMCGVPSFAFDSVRFTKQAHDQAIRRMIEQASGAPLRIADVMDGASQADEVLSRIAPHKPG